MIERFNMANINSVALKNLNKQIIEVENDYLNAIAQNSDSKSLKLAQARKRHVNAKTIKKKNNTHFIQLRPNFTFNVTTRIVQIIGESKSLQKKQLFEKINEKDYDIFERFKQNITINLVLPQRILDEWQQLAHLKGTNRRNYLSWVISQKYIHPVQSQSNTYLKQIELIYGKDSKPKDLAPYGGPEKFNTFNLVINRTVLYPRLKKKALLFFRNSKDIDPEKNLYKIITLYICFCIDSTYYQYCKYENEVHYMDAK